MRWFEVNYLAREKLRQKYCKNILYMIHQIRLTSVIYYQPSMILLSGWIKLN